MLCAYGTGISAIVLEVRFSVVHKNVRPTSACGCGAMLAEALTASKTGIKPIEGPEPIQGSMVDPALGFDAAAFGHGGIRFVTLHVVIAKNFNSRRRDW